MTLSFSFPLTHTQSHWCMHTHKHTHSASDSCNIRNAGCTPASLSPSLSVFLYRSALVLYLACSVRNASSCRPVLRLLSVTVATLPLQPWRPASRIQASLTSASSPCSSPLEGVSTDNTSPFLLLVCKNKCVVQWHSH